MIALGVYRTETLSMLRPHLRVAYLAPLQRPEEAVSAAAQSSPSPAPASVQETAQQPCFKFERPQPSDSHGMPVVLPSQRIPLLPLATPADPPGHPPLHPTSAQLRHEAQQSSAGRSQSPEGLGNPPALQSHPPQQQQGVKHLHSKPQRPVPSLLEVNQPWAGQPQSALDVPASQTGAQGVSFAATPSFSAAQHAPGQQAQHSAAQQAQHDAAQQGQYNAAQQAQHNANLQRVLLGLAPLPINGTAGAALDICACVCPTAFKH